MTCCIYVVFDKDGIVCYVGRSSNVPRRLREHTKRLGYKVTGDTILKVKCTNGNHLCRAAETAAIKHYRGQGLKLLNKVDYSTGAIIVSAEAREKLSQALLGRKCTWADKISEAQKGIPKNWSAKGRARVAKNQFKEGDNRYAELNREQRERMRTGGLKAWADPEKRAKMLTNLTSRNGQKRYPTPQDVPKRLLKTA